MSDESKPKPTVEDGARRWAERNRSDENGAPVSSSRMFESDSRDDNGADIGRY